ncbi:hypothetical protein BJV78DRAFT_190835 [Lactifluus subvellereus]|nr:hypothetical protein BJV78DRAFT_190835 [Lactifluus subvellereus]
MRTGLKIGGQRNKAVEYVNFKKRKMSAEACCVGAGIELGTVTTGRGQFPLSESERAILHHLPSPIAFLDFTDCNDNFNPGDLRICLALVSSTPSQFTKPVSRIFDRSDLSGIWGKRWVVSCFSLLRPRYKLSGRRPRPQISCCLFVLNQTLETWILSLD